MDQSLQILCDTLKKTIRQMKPHSQAVSFMLLIGTTHQGKTTLLQQSPYQHVAVQNEQGADVYYHQNSVIVELSESWLARSKHLLSYTLKQLNRCHRNVKINGLLLCVDIHDLFLAEPTEYKQLSKRHAEFLERFGVALGYRVETAIVFTKLDALAGFCDFFQSEHSTDLQKPLGFSFSHAKNPKHDEYQLQFDHFIEVLGQQIIHKIHPARSSIKRTLIREFPLQLACLRAVIQSLIQHISPRRFCLSALYFTSAQQGMVSLDKLNKKIQQEYGLSVQDEFPQSTNYQAYFIEGALSAFHDQTKREAPRISRKQQWLLGSMMGLSGLLLIGIGHQYLTAMQTLDKASKELLAYDILEGQHHKQTEALYHLTNASEYLSHMTYHPFSSKSVVQQFKLQLQTDTDEHLNAQFIPHVLSSLERVMTDPHQPPAARYDALKIYLMFSSPEHLVKQEIESWCYVHWKSTHSQHIHQYTALLKKALQQPQLTALTHPDIVRNTRNDLNALPAAYLYYALAKRAFPKDTIPLAIDGFSLSNPTVPSYLTKAGFQSLLPRLPAIASQLQREHWVLDREDAGDLTKPIQTAYCQEYVLWWQTFMRRTRPLHVNQYSSARALAQSLQKPTGLTQLVDFMQQQLSPELQSNAQSTLFNEAIASQFATLNFMSKTSLQRVSETIEELERFVSTLAMVNDQGKTAFMLTRGRFEGDRINNPLSTLYAYAHQLPAPLSDWMKNLADDTWFTLINDSKTYINQQWQTTVWRDYQAHIAQRYPFDSRSTQDISIHEFNRFFSTHGTLNTFIEHYLKPFIDTAQPQWVLKQTDEYVLPMSPDVLNELIRANIVTHMFFNNQEDASKITFSLQKISLDPMVRQLQLSIGSSELTDTQESDGITAFEWPESNATLTLQSIDAKRYVLEELGPWAFFKILQKVNVLTDDDDPSSLEILFEINGNSGRYLLKTNNKVNPFTPGILNGFTLPTNIV